MQNWVRPSAQKAFWIQTTISWKRTTNCETRRWSYDLGFVCKHFKKRYSTWASCSSGTANVDKKRGECTSFQEWKETLSNAFRGLRKVSLTPLSLCQFSTSGLLLEKKVLKHCIQNILPPGEVWLKLFAEKKDFWIYTELSLRLKHLGCSKHIQIKLQTLFILHFPLQALLHRMFLFFFFPKVHDLEKYILCRSTQIFTTIYVTFRFLSLRFIWNIMV